MRYGPLFCRIIFLSWLQSRCLGWMGQSSCHSPRKWISSGDRRMFLGTIVWVPGMCICDGPVQASNLPVSNEADISNVGAVEALEPIVILRYQLAKLESELSQRVDHSLLTSKNIPKTEKEFKRIFDQYSDPISYKQKFLDQNAFLVYYTKGFDGPGRANIEDDINERQTQQFGLRNEAWISWENFLTEIGFLDDADNDCAKYLSQTTRAIDSYFAMVPADDLKTAKERCGAKW